MILTRSRLTVVVTLAVLLAAVAIFTNVLPFRQILAQHEALARADAELEVLEAENERLAAEAEALMSDAEVERMAREYFGYVMPGEQAIVIVSPPGEPIPRPVVAAPELEELPWWQSVWDFLTGHDLTE